MEQRRSNHVELDADTPLTLVQDVVEALAVGRRCQSAAQIGVVERRRVAVDDQVGAHVGAPHRALRLRCLGSNVPVQRHQYVRGIGHVELAGDEAQHAGGTVWHDAKFNPVEIRKAWLPAAGVPLQPDDLIQAVFDKPERPGADWLGAHRRRRYVAGIDWGPSRGQHRDERRLTACRHATARLDAARRSGRAILAPGPASRQLRNDRIHRVPRRVLLVQHQVVVNGREGDHDRRGGASSWIEGLGGVSACGKVRIPPCFRASAGPATAPTQISMLATTPVIHRRMSVGIAVIPFRRVYPDHRSGSGSPPADAGDLLPASLLPASNFSIVTALASYRRAICPARHPPTASHCRCC